MRWLCPCAVATLLAGACGGATPPGGGPARGSSGAGLFTGTNPWNTPVATAAKSASSGAMPTFTRIHDCTRNGR